MFAAILIVCSLHAVNCELIGKPDIYVTDADCRAGAAHFVAVHDVQLTKGYGAHEVSVWCRQIPGLPS